MQRGGVPGSQDDAATAGVLWAVSARLDLLNTRGELIHALPTVVSMHVGVGGPEVSPLESVHGS